jgi:hypothetical protein
MSKYSLPGNLYWWLLGYRSAYKEAEHKLSVVNAQNKVEPFYNKVGYSCDYKHKSIKIINYSRHNNQIIIQYLETRSCILKSYKQEVDYQNNNVFK